MTMRKSPRYQPGGSVNASQFKMSVKPEGKKKKKIRFFFIFLNNFSKTQ